jgi:hypothetical protein
LDREAQHLGDADADIEAEVATGEEAEKGIAGTARDRLLIGAVGHDERGFYGTKVWEEPGEAEHSPLSLWERVRVRAHPSRQA